MKKLMAANWKMYKTGKEAEETASALANMLIRVPADREVVIFAPFTALVPCLNGMNGKSELFLGAQNFYPAGEGAFTGEVSPRMLKDCGCRFVLAGHSERRHVLGESSAFVGKKVAFALESGLDVILCIGETLEERDQGRLREVLESQLRAGLAGVPVDIGASRLAFAYEPVWAIGTGKVAGPEEIVQAHALTRELIEKILPGKSALLRILYGGSVKADNASLIIGLDNVDGLLVGGASLQAESFYRIAMAGLEFPAFV